MRLRGSELWYPCCTRLIEAGGSGGRGPQAAACYWVSTYPGLRRGDRRVVAADFDGLLLPGGFMPDKLRRDPQVKQLIREFAAAGKCVAAICHGGWMAISAGVYRGIRVTGSLGIKDDLENCGAIWEDAVVVVDGPFVSSRKPDDLPYFVEAMIQVMAERSSGLAIAPKTGGLGQNHSLPLRQFPAWPIESRETVHAGCVAEPNGIPD